MTRRQLVVAEWGLVLLGVLPIVLALGAFGRHPATIHDPRPMTAMHDTATPAQHLTDALLHGVVELAPFRLSRQPAIPYQPGRSDLTPDAPQAPKPALALSGVILGAHPAALIEGVPGREGSTLLALGDTAAGLTLRRITRDHVVITGLDTTWTLMVRETWSQ